MGPSPAGNPHMEHTLLPIALMEVTMLRSIMPLYHRFLFPATHRFHPHPLWHMNGHSHHLMIPRGPACCCRSPQPQPSAMSWLLMREFVPNLALEGPWGRCQGLRTSGVEEQGRRDPRCMDASFWGFPRLTTIQMRVRASSHHHRRLQPPRPAFSSTPSHKIDDASRMS